MLSADRLKNAPWMLDPKITYLNHGSFGARPVEVFEAQIALKREFEASPIHFLDREGKQRLAEAREVISTFLGCVPDNLGFVDNATTAVGCVLQSLDFPPGAEIVTTSHVYNGVRQMLRASTHRQGWTYKEIDVPTPIVSPEQICHAITQGFTNKTRLLVVDHIASVTGIIFPVAELVAICRERGIAILIDGAHAPGMIDLDIDALSPDWYVGNLHKWVCGPPGAGFLWVNDSHIDSTHPMAVSHFYEQGFTSEFDWQGTRDITSVLGASIAVLWGEQFGWESIRNHNHQLAVLMQEKLLTRWGVPPMSPRDGSMIGAMASVQLPLGFPTDPDIVNQLRVSLYEEYMIEVPILPWQNGVLVRISAQMYLAIEDLDRLIIALEDSKARFKNK